MAVVPRKIVISKEQMKQNSEDKLQNQWKLRLKYRSDQENYNSSTLLNPGNIDWEKQMFNFSYQAVNSLSPTGLQSFFTKHIPAHLI